MTTITNALIPAAAIGCGIVVAETYHRIHAPDAETRPSTLIRTLGFGFTVLSIRALKKCFYILRNFLHYLPFVDLYNLLCAIGESSGLLLQNILEYLVLGARDSYTIITTLKFNNIYREIGILIPSMVFLLGYGIYDTYLKVEE